MILARSCANNTLQVTCIARYLGRFGIAYLLVPLSDEISMFDVNGSVTIPIIRGGIGQSVHRGGHVIDRLTVRNSALDFAFGNTHWAFVCVGRKGNDVFQNALPTELAGQKVASIHSLLPADRRR